MILTEFDWWEEPKPHRVPMFYIAVDERQHSLQFPVSDYFAYVVGFDPDPLVEELAGLGFRPAGKHWNPTVALKMHNDQAFFDALFDIVVRTADEFEDTLQQEQR